MKILCSQRSFVMIRPPWILEVSCIVLVFPPGSTFPEQFCGSCRSLSAMLYLLTCPRGDLPAATSARPRVESHQPPPRSPAWRGGPWSFSSLETPSALRRPGPPHAAASGHPRHCMAIALATAPAPERAASKPTELDISTETMHFASMQRAKSHHLVKESKSIFQPGEKTKLFSCTSYGMGDLLSPLCPLACTVLACGCGGFLGPWLGSLPSKPDQLPRDQSHE